MKILLALLLLSFGATAQNSTIQCTQVNCPITIVGPTDSAMIFGASTIISGNNTPTVTDSVVSFLWKQTSGPTTAVMVTPNAKVTMLRKLSVGVYVFSLTATTKLGSSQTVPGSTVIVNAAPVAPPTPPSILVTWKLLNGVWVPTLTTQ